VHIITKLCNWKYENTQGRDTNIFRFLFIIMNAILMIDYLQYSRIFHLYGDVTIAGEGLQKFGLYSALRAFEQEFKGYLSCHKCCDTGQRFFQSHPKDHPIQSPLTTHKGMWRIYSNPDLHGEIPTKKCKSNIRQTWNLQACLRSYHVLSMF
jgi:hypothetical protein